MLHSTILLPERAALFDRIDRRLQRMIEQGAADEVRALLKRDDVPATAPVRRAIGVTEIAAWLSGEIDRDAAIAAAQLATRRYAKRQYTWFRNQSPPDWPRVPAFGEDAAAGRVIGLAP